MIDMDNSESQDLYDLWCVNTSNREDGYELVVEKKKEEAILWFLEGKATYPKDWYAITNPGKHPDEQDPTDIPERIRVQSMDPQY